MAKPSISCVIPVFNGEKYLREAVESALTQTLPPSEVIVVDDGSTDSTAAVIAELGSRVRALRQDHAGPSTARNCGIHAAHGDLVSFLDADDRWAPTKLERQVEHLRRRPEVGGCVTYVQNFWVPELRDEAEAFRDHRIARPQPGFLATTLVARREVFAAVGDFDETLRFGDSTDWFLRARQLGVVIDVVAEVLYSRRIHDRNRSRVRGADSREEFLSLVRRHLDAKRGSGETGVAPRPGRRR